MTIEWEDFQRVDLRVGTVERVELFPEARRPAFKMWIDLGELGVRKTSAQLTGLYRADELVGRQVLCVCNFRPKQIGPFLSEVLVTGLVIGAEQVVLVQPDRPVPNGTRLA